MLKATRWHSFTNINFVMLQRADQNRVVGAAGQVGERQGFMAELRMHSEKSRWKTLRKEALQRHLQVHTGCYGKSSAGGDELVQPNGSKVPRQLCADMVLCF